MKLASLAILAAAALGAPAFAVDPAAPAGAETMRIGQRTEALLELQRSGRLAGSSQRLPGEQADAARRRYVNSFGQPAAESRTPGYAPAPAK